MVTKGKLVKRGRGRPRSTGRGAPDRGSHVVLVSADEDAKLRADALRMGTSPATLLRDLWLSWRANSKPVNHEGLRQATANVRAALDAIGDRLADADDSLSEIEHAAGLVLGDGSRVDEQKGVK